MKQAAIVTIGDEILIGQIVDTNSSHIATALNLAGFKVQYMCSIGDEREEIINHLSFCLNNYDIVITTGGLGPTKDDITKKVLAELFGTDKYYQSDAQFSIVESLLGSRGKDFVELNRSQAYVPVGSEVIPNTIGTAPCMVFRFPKEKFKHSPILYSLPGVPFETIKLIPTVLDDIKSHFSSEDIYHKTILTFGIAESALSDLIEPWELALPKDMRLAYLPNPITGIKLRLSIYGCNRGEAMQRIANQFSKLKEIIGNVIYGEDDDTLQSVIGDILSSNNLSLSAAESCTGGKVSALITSIPGSSRYYLGSVTSYSNEIKENILGVNPQIIDKYGAVSKECVEEMAVGVLKLMNSDIAVSTSGIAGPDGGSPEKPVGTAWLAVAYKNKESGEIDRKSVV